MLLKELHNFPVKSLAGNKLNSVFVEKRGFKNDRRFMFIDRDNRFVTARKHHKLMRIKVAIVGNDLIFKDLSTQSELIQPFQLSNQKIKVTIWESESTGHLISPNFIDAWISKLCDEPLRLVYMNDDDIRLVNSKYGNSSDIVSFADGYPVLVTNTKSLDDLNLKLDSPITMNRFRPNLVIEGNLPWEEDHWNKIKIGDVVLRMAKPCSRCVVITINPETGETSKEPLQTLSKFREVNNKVLFGMNAIVEKSGSLSCGSEVELIA